MKKQNSTNKKNKDNAKKHDSKNHNNTKQQHPSLDIVSANGTELRGKKIVLCVSGSVAAYKAIELARLLMRHGSNNVTCVASKAATRLIRPAYLKWATGNDVITDLTGNLEHIRLADYNKSDMIIVYPATANTIGRLANGMDDAPVSTVLTVAFGSKIPIMICPAMHESMYENPAVLRNVKFLSKKQITFVGPQMIEGKAKALEPEHILEHVIARLTPNSPLRGKRILLSAGPTVEYIDPIRMIINNSSGKTGILLATELMAAGARVTIIYGPGKKEPPKNTKIIRVHTSAQMHNAIKTELQKTKFDAVVMAAAISDYTPVNKRNTKIKSNQTEYTLRLKKTPKIISMIKEIQKDTLVVGFKAEANVSKATLIKSARNTMNKYNADMIIANDIGEKYQKKNTNSNNVIVINGSKTIVESGWHKKEYIAKFIKKIIEQKFADT